MNNLTNSQSEWGGELFNNYNEVLYRYAIQKFPNCSHDMINIGIVNVIIATVRYTIPENINCTEIYLKKSLINEMIRLINSNRKAERQTRYTAEMIPLGIHPVVSIGYGNEEDEHQKQEEIFEAFLAILTQTERTIFVLRIEHKFPYEDISRVVGSKKPGNCKMIFCQLKKKFEIFVSCRNN